MPARVPSRGELGMARNFGHFLAGWPGPNRRAPASTRTPPPGTRSVLFARWLREAVDAGVARAARDDAGDGGRGGPPRRAGDGPGGRRGAAFWVAASETSPKGKQLGRVPVAALVFHWPLLGRQVRVRGTVRPAGAARTAAAFERLSAHERAELLVDRQSGPLHDEEWLSNALGDPTELLALEAAGPVAAPAWRLWGVDAGRMEFFQAERDGHHVRLRYSRDETGYATELLRP